MTETSHFVDPILFVPDATKDNYASAARMAARQNGTTVGEEWAALIANFEAQHEADGAAGWNHLAAWAKTADPETIGLAADPAELRKARALASAIQDPAVTTGLDFEGDTEEAKAVRHAHETNAVRQESGFMSPAGSDPVTPGQPEDEDEDGTKKRSGRRPSRTATPNGPQETR